VVIVLSALEMIGCSEDALGLSRDNDGACRVHETCFKC